MSEPITSTGPEPAASSDAGPESAPRLRSDGWRSREAILDAAAAALPRDRRTTMQDIADSAGVGRSTIYRYFPTRGDLERALSARSQQPGARAVIGSETRSEGRLVDGRSARRSVARRAPTRLNSTACDLPDSLGVRGRFPSMRSRYSTRSRLIWSPNSLWLKPNASPECRLPCTWSTSMVLVWCGWPARESSQRISTTSSRSAARFLTMALPRSRAGWRSSSPARRPTR